MFLFGFYRKFFFMFGRLQVDTCSVCEKAYSDSLNVQQLQKNTYINEERKHFISK